MKILWKNKVLVIMTGAMLGASCGRNSGPALSASLTAGESPEGIDQLITDNNDFAMRLYQDLTKDSEENSLVSPFSITSALAMTYVGAKAETASQMAGTLGLPNDVLATSKAMSFLLKDFSASKEQDGYELNIANKSWLQESFPFTDEYLNLTKNYFNAGIEKLDFKLRPEESRLTINQWVEEQTNQHIKDLLPENSINKETRLILTNAIYFLAEWQSIFPKEFTQDDKFFVTETESVDVAMMNQTASFPYFESDKYQAIEMKYAGKVINEEYNLREESDVSMVVVLPKPGTTLAEVKDQFSGAEVEKLFDNLNNNVVKAHLSLPKFKVKATYENLKGSLIRLGMAKAFDRDHADFSGITGLPTNELRLVIDKVVHKTFIDVYEEGTEATGATAVIMAEVTAVDPEVPLAFRADRPFMYFIKDKTDSILFVGSLVQPQ